MIVGPFTFILKKYKDACLTYSKTHLNISFSKKMYVFRSLTIVYSVPCWRSRLRQLQKRQIA